MKALSYFSSAGLLACTLLFATGCEKATVAPEMAVSNSQNAARSKDRNVEVRVTGTMLAHQDANGVTVPAKAFTATLQIQDFVYIGSSFVGQGQMQQIGGGLTAEDKALLEGSTLSYTVTLPDYTYVAPPANSFTFKIAQAGYSPNYLVGQLVQLDMEYPIVIDANTRKFPQISAQVDALNNYLYATLHDGTNYYSEDDYNHAADELGAIADITGRF